MAQSISNVAYPVAATAPANVQVSSSNQLNVHSLASKDPVVQNVTIPHLNELRKDVFIQNQGEKRLKELADSVQTGNCKQKSLRG